MQRLPERRSPGEIAGSTLDGYVVDGHVPIYIVRKLCAERPAIVGITLPGMPSGSPIGTKTETFTVLAVTKHRKAPTVFATQ